MLLFENYFRIMTIPVYHSLDASSPHQSLPQSHVSQPQFSSHQHKLYSKQENSPPFHQALPQVAQQELFGYHSQYKSQDDNVLMR